MQYLVDTDWAIERTKGIPRTVRRIDELLPAGIGLSIVSLAELYDGILNGGNPQADERQLQSFLDQVTVIPLDDTICRIFAYERGRLRRQGKSSTTSIY